MNYICCSCFKWRSRTGKEKYKHVDLTTDDILTTETSCTQLLIDDGKDDEICVPNGGNGFVTHEERQIVKDKRYKDLIKLQIAQESDVLKTLALREAQVCMEEEKRFQKERLALFGEEGASETSLDAKVVTAHGDSRVSTTGERGGGDNLVGGSNHQHAVIGRSTSVPLHAVHQDKKSKDRNPTSTQPDIVNTHRSTNNSKDGDLEVDRVPDLFDEEDLFTSAQHLSDHSDPEKKMSPSGFKLEDDDDDMWSNEFVSASDSAHFESISSSQLNSADLNDAAISDT